MPLPSRRPTPPRRPVQRHPTVRQPSIYDNPFTAKGTGSTKRLPGPKPPAQNAGPRGIISPTVGGALGVGKLPELPPDPAYDQQVGAIDKGTKNTVAGLTGERDRTLLDYGYNVQYDADGNPLTNTLTFDPTNVFSRAAQLRKRWMEARSGTQNGMAAQGQLNSGAYGRAQRQNNYGESAQTDAEMKGLLNFLARNGSQVAAAKIAGETAKGEAMGARVARIPENPLYDPTRPAGSPGGPGSPTLNGSAPGGAGPRNYNARPYRTQVVPGKGEWHVYADGRRVFVRYK